MMKWHLRCTAVIGTIATMLTGVTTTEAAAPAAPMFARAKKLIAAEMVDPGSLQFRNLRTVHGVVQGKALTIGCGEYNARNKMGGYAGYATFAYEPTLMHGAISFKAEGGIDLFGDVDRSDTATETNARILAVCLGVPQ